MRSHSRVLRLAALTVASAATLWATQEPLPLMVRIAVREGWRDPNSLARRLHNPGMLVWARQPHAKAAAAGGWAEFDSDADGWRGLARDVLAKKRRGLSEETIWRRWTKRRNQ